MKWKPTLVKPLLKKPLLDPAYKNYRPVSNLPFVSKLLERVVVNQLMEYVNRNALLLPACTLAYRPHHSTETILLKVMSDLLQQMDAGDVSYLVLLDLSAAFDTSMIGHQQTEVLQGYH